jgi:hypothetical protein
MVEFSSVNEELARRYMELSLAKRDENEALFADFPFMDPMPKGVPISELHIKDDATLWKLVQRRQAVQDGDDATAESLDQLIQDRLNFLAVQRESAVREMNRKGRARRQSSITADRAEQIIHRRKSEMLLEDPVYQFQFKELQDAVECGDLLRIKEADDALARRADEIEFSMTKEQIQAAREAEALKRKQDLAEQNAADAKRKAEIEAALLARKQAEGAKTREALDRMKDDAAARDQTTVMIKKMLVRMQRTNELSVTADEVGVLQGHFQRYDEDGSGAFSKKEFGLFFRGMFGERCTGREIDDIFEQAASSRENNGSLTFEDFVEVYREIARQDAVKRDPKLMNKLKSTLGTNKRRVAAAEAKKNVGGGHRPKSPPDPPGAGKDAAFKRQGMSPQPKPLEPHKPAPKVAAKKK